MPWPKRFAAEAQPKALYSLAFIEAKGEDYIIADGVRFTSRVLRVNLDDAHRCFPFVCTSGREAEAWAERQSGFMRRFWADALNQAVLHAAALAIAEHLQDRYQLGPVSDDESRIPGGLAAARAAFLSSPCWVTCRQPSASSSRKAC